MTRVRSLIAPVKQLERLLGPVIGAGSSICFTTTPRRRASISHGLRAAGCSRSW